MDAKKANNDPSTGDGLQPDQMTSRELFYDFNAHFSTHERILKDKIRMTTFRDVIYHNRDLFKGKIVLEVGCGTTGILSLFAADAGAARVFSIESSPIAAYYAEKIFEDNELGDGVITLIKGKVEDVTLPDGIKQVDIIISDWIGHCLFKGSKLSSVISARDKWLDKKNGLMFPDRCKLYISGIEDRQYKEARINWWDKVYEFDMSSIKSLAISEPLVSYVNENQIVTTSYIVKKIDLYTVKEQDLSFSQKFHLITNRSDQIHALVTYFDVEFIKCHTRMGFSTSPDSPYTHLKQTIFFINDPIKVRTGEKLSGNFSMKQNKSNEIDIDIELSSSDKKCTKFKENHTYRLC